MCQLCDVQKTEAIVYNDGELLGTFLISGISKFHFKLFPKAHEEKTIPANLFEVTKKLIETIKSITATDSYNLLLNIGIANPFKHISLDILPRFENDNVSLVWKVNESLKEQLLNTSNLLSNAFFGYSFKIEQKVVIDQKLESKTLNENEKFLFWKKLP
ncbi:MAG: hypothetical protein QXD62_02520 [Candidatus Woesearchaeota archaeon]